MYGERKMKKIIIMSTMLVILLIPSTMISVAKTSDLLDETNRNGPKDNTKEFILSVFQQIADKHYEKKGWVPQGIMDILSSLGR